MAIVSDCFGSENQSWTSSCRTHTGQYVAAVDTDGPVWFALGAFDDLDLLFFTAIPEFDLRFFDAEPTVEHLISSRVTAPLSRMMHIH